MNERSPAAPKTAVTYARTARPNPYKQNFLTMQARLYAARHSMVLVREFGDWGHSASISSRPALNALCDYVAEHDVDTCVMVEIVSLGRTIPIMLHVMERLQSSGIRTLLLLDVKDSAGAPTCVDLDEMVQAVHS